VLKQLSKIHRDRRYIMKKSLQIGIMLVLLTVAFGCVNAVSAQRAGDYKETSVKDAEVIAAANYAVREEGRKEGTSIKLISIERAEIQVVAGTNYRLCLKVEINNETKDAKAVVYRNLSKTYLLTDWEEASCSKSASIRNPAKRSVRTR
jgi:Aspartic acid proteinase inhibitor